MPDPSRKRPDPSRGKPPMSLADQVARIKKAGDDNIIKEGWENFIAASRDPEAMAERNRQSPEELRLAETLRGRSGDLPSFTFAIPKEEHPSIHRIALLPIRNKEGQVISVNFTGFYENGDGSPANFSGSLLRDSGQLSYADVPGLDIDREWLTGKIAAEIENIIPNFWVQIPFDVFGDREAAAREESEEGEPTETTSGEPSAVDTKRLKFLGEQEGALFGGYCQSASKGFDGYHVVFFAKARQKDAPNDGRQMFAVLENASTNNAAYIFELPGALPFGEEDFQERLAKTAGTRFTQDEARGIIGDHLGPLVEAGTLSTRKKLRESDEFIDRVVHNEKGDWRSRLSQTILRLRAGVE